MFALNICTTDDMNKRPCLVTFWQLELLGIVTGRMYVKNTFCCAWYDVISWPIIKADAPIKNNVSTLCIEACSQSVTLNLLNQPSSVITPQKTYALQRVFCCFWKSCIQYYKESMSLCTGQSLRYFTSRPRCLPFRCKTILMHSMEKACENHRA